MVAANNEPDRGVQPRSLHGGLEAGTGTSLGPEAALARAGATGQHVVEPPEATLRLLLELDLRDGRQDLPFLLREPQEVPEQRKRAVDARRGEARGLASLVLPSDGPGRKAALPVGGDPGSRQIPEPRRGAECLEQVFRDAPVCVEGTASGPWL